MTCTRVCERSTVLNRLKGYFTVRTMKNASEQRSVTDDEVSMDETKWFLQEIVALEQAFDVCDVPLCVSDTIKPSVD